MNTHTGSPGIDDLGDRNIMVTGAGAGIGRAVALAAAAAGARVLLLGRTIAPLEATWDAIVAAGGPEPVIVPLNLASDSEQPYAEVAEAVDQQLGPLHGLVHCAGALGPKVPIEHYPATDWHHVMAVNVNGAFLLTRALLPALRAAPAASLVFSSSSVGRSGRAYWGAYAVAKFAIEGLVQVLADELENTSAVRVNSVNPGGTRTAMRAAAYPAENPLSVPDPASRAPLYLYLLSDRSNGISGQQFDANGWRDPATA